MTATTTRVGQPFGGQQSGNAGGQQGEQVEKHSEGPVALAIEQYTAQIPSDVYLWAAGASILGSLGLKVAGKDHAALFVGQWVAPFLLLGVYNKIVKVAGSDRVHAS